MFAVIAAIVFGIATVESAVGEVSLVPAGLCLLAIHHVVGEWSPWRR